MSPRKELIVSESSEPAPVPPTGRSHTKREAIRAAARDLFLRDGYLGTSMDEVAATARVSKQTVYQHFSDKASLFSSIVLAEIARSEAETNELLEQLPDADDFAGALRQFARDHLIGVMTPTVIALRRTVIGEATRFPDLARTWWDRGPRAGHETLAQMLARAADNGHLRRPTDLTMAAQQLNWLVLSIPLNAAMFLGEDAGFDEAQLNEIADEAVRVFLAAYAP